MTKNPRPMDETLKPTAIEDGLFAGVFYPRGVRVELALRDIVGAVRPSDASVSELGEASALHQYYLRGAGRYWRCQRPLRATSRRFVCESS